MAEGIHCRRHLRGSANRDADAVDARTKARRHSDWFIARRFFGLRCELPFCDAGPDNPPGPYHSDWESAFRATAVLLALIEASGLAWCIRLLHFEPSGEE